MRHRTQFIQQVKFHEMWDFRQSNTILKVLWKFNELTNGKV